MWANLDRYEHVFDGYRDNIEKSSLHTLLDSKVSLTASLGDST